MREGIAQGEAMAAARIEAETIAKVVERLRESAGEWMRIGEHRAATAILAEASAMESGDWKREPRGGEG
jgi:hypothetical protein